MRYDKVMVVVMPHYGRYVKLPNLNGGGLHNERKSLPIKVAGFVITSELVLHLALLVFCMRQILHRINYHNFSSVTLNY